MMSTMRRSQFAVVGGLAASVLAAGECPRNLEPYARESSPFNGFPLTPNAWDFDHEECWAEKYPMCAASMQAPIDLNLNVTGHGCNSPVGNAERLQANYVPVSGERVVAVSSYMRSVYVSGSFGNVFLKDADGNDVEYESTAVHITANSLHTVNGQHADAELMIIHKPKTQSASLPEHVVVSLLFNEGTEASSIFSEMGFSEDHDTHAFESGRTWLSPSIIFLDRAYQGVRTSSFHSYSGSAPVPPCTGSIHYIVLSETQSVGAHQVAKLKSVLQTHTGGIKKRAPKPRYEGEHCRDISENSDVLTRHNQECAAETDNSALCWAERCDKSPIDVEAATADMTAPAVDMSLLLNHKTLEEVTAKASKYTLDFTGDFGSILVNGRVFEAKKVSVKAVSQHTYNGEHYAGELVFEHLLYGDDMVPYAEHAAEHADKEKHDDEHHDEEHDEHHDEDHDEQEEEEHENSTDSHDRRLESEEPEHEEGEHHQPVFEGPHRIMISIPLELGDENTFLRELGVGVNQFQRSVRDGESYTISNPVHVPEDIAASTSGDFYWYSGGPTTPGACPDMDVKWMVFKKPLSVSFEQLNFLHLEVSGFDSTPPALLDGAVFLNGIPANAIESGASCEESTGYIYSQPSCWGTESEVCASGTAQSPINIDTEAISTVGEDRFLPRLSWKPLRGLSVGNNGESLGWETNQMGYTTTIGPNGFPKYYQVTEVSLRMPSEHLVNGKQYPAELQIMQKNQITVLELDDNDVLFTSIFFDFGEESKLLNQLLPEELPKFGESISINKPVDLMWGLGPAVDGNYFKYDGSYTTPGCQEAAQWVIFETPMTLTREQFERFKLVFPSPGNNRPVQALNGRSVVKNTMVEADPVDYRFFLNREMGHDRETLTPPAFIIFPILGTITLCTVIMTATFQREDKHQKARNAGGLEEPSASTVGRKYNRID